MQVSVNDQGAFGVAFTDEERVLIAKLCQKHNVTQAAVVESLLTTGFEYQRTQLAADAARDRMARVSSLTREERDEVDAKSAEAVDKALDDIAARRGTSTPETETGRS